MADIRSGYHRSSVSDGVSLKSKKLSSLLVYSIMHLY